MYIKKAVREIRIVDLKMSIVPDSSGEGGNTHSLLPSLIKRQSPIRKNHFFTYYYKDSSEFPAIEAELKAFAYKGKLQTEICPKTDRKHLQGMVWCKSKCRDTSFKTLKGGHFEKIADEEDVANYCHKDESHDNLWRCGWGLPEPKYVVKIETLYEWEMEIVELLKGEPDGRSIHWYWEPHGCAGKTTFQKYVYTNFNRVVVLSGKCADMKNAIVTYEKENKYLPKIIMINIPRAQGIDMISYKGIEEIKDMFFYSGKYEGGMVCGASPFVIIFANEEPIGDKMSVDRFKITRI